MVVLENGKFYAKRELKYYTEIFNLLKKVNDWINIPEIRKTVKTERDVVFRALRAMKKLNLIDSKQGKLRSRRTTTLYKIKNIGVNND